MFIPPLTKFPIFRGTYSAIIGLAVLLLAALWIQPVHAQTPAPSTMTATVDTNNLSTDDAVTLTVVVTTESVVDPPLPVLPPLGSLVLIDQGSTSRISIRDNRATIEAVHTYVLRPTEAGTPTIAPITITLAGETLSTDPIFLTVSQGDPNVVIAPASDLPAATLSKLIGQDFFVEAEVDKLTPYLGEQVTYTLRFFRAVNIVDQPRYDAPSFTGFWNSDEPEQNQYRVQAPDRRYDVLELSTVIFPNSIGTLTIGPSTLRVPRGRNEPETLLRTTSVGLTVLPHPENPPEDFKGATGKFDISAEFEATSSIVNDPVIMTVTISGEGNPTTLPNPDWPKIDGWRAFESATTVDAQIIDGILAGRKVYERILIPSLSGEYTIPPVAYSYFDPEAVEYRSVATRPIAISIIPGASGLAPLDVQQLKPVPATLSSVSRPLTQNGIYWVVWIVPLIFLGSLVTWRFFRNRLRYDTPESRRRNAHRKARKMLRQLSRNGHDPYSVSAQTLTTYISDKLDHTVHGMTYESVGELLITRGVDSELIEELTEFLATNDRGRFAPNANSNGSNVELIQRTRVLLSGLEKGLKA